MQDRTQIKERSSGRDHDAISRQAKPQSWRWGNCRPNFKVARKLRRTAPEGALTQVVPTIRKDEALTVFQYVVDIGDAEAGHRKGWNIQSDILRKLLLLCA